MANVNDWTNEEEVSAYLKKILDKKAFDRSGLIYGMGHAVYTLSDPREVILKEFARKLAEEKGEMEKFALYEMVERLAGLSSRNNGSDFIQTESVLQIFHVWNPIFNTYHNNSIYHRMVLK